MKKAVLSFVFLCSCLLIAACGGNDCGHCGRDKVCVDSQCRVRCTNDYTCIHDVEVGPSFECKTNLGYCVKRTASNYPVNTDGGVYASDGGLAVDAGVADAGVPDAGWSPCGLTLEQMQTDANHCGNCETKCNLPNATSKCVAGACAIDKCAVGKKDCDNNPATGCESDSATDVNNCRQCGRACNFEFSGEYCDEGMCIPTTCNQDRGECDPNDGIPCETYLPNDAENCGRCGRNCNDVYPHSLTFCLDRTCEWANCRTGWGACNANVRGCNTNLLTDNANCGECGAKCDIPNVYANCESGACVPSRCKEGFADADNNLLNGCEIDLRNDVHNCGFIGNNCEAANVSTMCVNGLCVRSGCEGDYVTCPSDATQCGTNIRTDIDNCGGCGIRCSALYPNMDVTCNNMACIPIACLEPYQDCRWQPGCETNTDTSMSHCGACDVKCEILNVNATCEGGQCKPLSCKDGFADSDNDLSNGCEINLRTDSRNCGEVGIDCAKEHASSVCERGMCRVTACDMWYANCDGDMVTNGCEVNLRTDANHCGACSIACVYPHANGICDNTICKMGACQGRYLDCNNSTEDGCESDKWSDTYNCGECGNKCVYSHGVGMCLDSFCKLLRCDPGYVDKDGDPLNGCEVDLRTDANNCREINHKCAATNASSMCVDGLCTPTGCDAGYATCPLSSNPAYCAIDLKTDAANCGSCGRNCETVYPGMIVACSDRVCQAIGCKTGKADCKAAQAGCETDTLTDNANCGGCGVKCEKTNAYANCDGGQCVALRCKEGFADADNDLNNGCEIDLTKDSLNCGRINNNCARTNVATMCDNGVCVPTGCDANFARCPTSALLCDVNLSVDTANCGSCGYDCETVYPGSVVTCGDSLCNFVRCKTGKGACNANVRGCPTDLLTDNANCGGCGVECKISNVYASCSASQCVPSRCKEGFADADNNLSNGCEIDLRKDSSNCGEAGHDCAFTNASSMCVDGVCTPTGCDDGYATCPLSSNPAYCSIDLTTDTANCGSCGRNCETVYPGMIVTCTDSVCVPTGCKTGKADCKAAQAGCETNTTSDSNNCGGCDVKCDVANGYSACENSVCVFKGCKPKYADCDNNLALNGCEVDLTSNVAFCGSCTKSCSFISSGAICTDGVCQPTTCDLWKADCDADMITNGCETNLLTDADHCGSCSTHCGFDNAGSVCNSAVCQLGPCKPGYLDCNGRQNDGCEINKMTDPNNCGGCGTVCGTGSTCVNGVCEVSGTPGTPLPAVTSITCNICCPTGLGSPVVWYGDGPPNTPTWTPADSGSCGLVVMQAGTFCKRGLHPTYETADSGWFTYNCNATWSGATASDVSSCVDQTGAPLTFHNIAGVVNITGVREVAIEGTCQ